LHLDSLIDIVSDIPGLEDLAIMGHDQYIVGRKEDAYRYAADYLDYRHEG